MPDDMAEEDSAELAPLERRLDEMLDRLDDPASGNGLPSLRIELKYELIVLAFESRRPLFALW